MHDLIASEIKVGTHLWFSRSSEVGGQAGTIVTVSPESRTFKVLPLAAGSAELEFTFDVNTASPPLRRNMWIISAEKMRGLIAHHKQALQVSLESAQQKLKAAETALSEFDQHASKLA